MTYDEQKCWEALTHIHSIRKIIVCDSKTWSLEDVVQIGLQLLYAIQDVRRELEAEDKELRIRLDTAIRTALEREIDMDQGGLSRGEHDKKRV